MFLSLFLYYKQNMLWPQRPILASSKKYVKYLKPIIRKNIHWNENDQILSKY